MAKPNAREVAYELLLAVATADAYANLLLPKLISRSELDSRDAGFAQELSFGTIRNQIFYDRIIEACANRQVGAIEPAALAVLRIGAHQLLAMRVPSHAALSETVELAKHKLKPVLTGFINGVLRRVSEKSREQWLTELVEAESDSVEKLSIEFSHPSWVIRALKDSLQADGKAEQLRDLLEQDNIAPLVNLVALPGLADRDDLFDAGASLEGLSPIGAVLPSGDPAKLAVIATGKARVQDQGSQLAALALVNASEVSDKEEWLDMCAGPGGKAALLAAEAKLQKAELVCNELQEHRSKLVAQALKAVNPDVYIRTGDGRDLGADAPDSFDRILLDAPCSGLGALRRRPESRFRRTKADVNQLAKLQQQLLESAFAGLKPGGVLAYVTCSPHLAETAAIVDWALRKYESQVELLDARAILGKVSPQILETLPDRKTVQLWPHIHQTDAMFIALLQKKTNRVKA
ncbi:MAG: transcription antitermination factor NusB [Micrococcales bacterium]